TAPGARQLDSGSGLTGRASFSPLCDSLGKTGSQVWPVRERGVNSMKRLVPVLVLAAAAAALWPVAGGASIFKGTVVASQRGTLLVASSSGALSAVRGHARIGSRIALGGGRPIGVGRATNAVIRGIVVRRTATTLVLSSTPHLIAIPNRLRRRLRAGATAPTTGAVPTTAV